MRTSSFPEVRQLELFKSMDEEIFTELMNAAYLQSFPAHVQLISEGVPADFLFIIIEGCAELFANANGREAVLAMVRPVGSFILAAVLKDAVHLMSARTTQPSRVLMVPAQNIRSAFKRDDAFARAIVIEMANYFRAIVKEHKDLRLRTAVERVANRLLRYHKHQGENGSIELPYGKRTLASLLGMTPENLSRAFNTLKPYGVVVDGSHIILNDLTSLETLAKPNSLIDDNTT